MKLIRFFQIPEKYGFANPKPAKSFIPNWYKEAETKFFNEQKGQDDLGLKTCMPFLDTLTSGYILSTPVNIYVNEKRNNLDHVFNSEGGMSIRWDGPPAFEYFINERHSGSGATMPRPAGHYPNHLAFSGHWNIKTPKGWSILYTHPLNRHDLPFTIASGIIDSDKFFAPGNIPFFLKKDFSGVIPKGTPIAQIIPIKRETWHMVENDKGLSDKDLIQGTKARNKDSNYKKRSWQRKRYE